MGLQTVSNQFLSMEQLEQEGCKKKKRGIKKLYLVTSDYHKRRASVKGEIVLGSRGIDFKTVSVPSQNNSEPVGKSIRDGVRSIVWVATGLGGGDE